MKKMYRKNRTMWLLAVCMLCPVSLFVIVAGSKVWASHVDAVKRAQTPKHCQVQHHRAGGFNRTSKEMARMSAIVAWSREVTTYGQNYSLWTNADRKSVRCRKLRGTIVYNCIAFGTPCKILHDQAPTQLNMASR